MLKKALIRQLSNRFKDAGQPISSDRIDSVAILSLHENSAEIDDLKGQLERLGKSPRIVTFISNFDKKKEYPLHSFSSKDIGITGSILSEELQFFTRQKYDYLLCLDRSGNDFIKYLLSKTTAQHRIGFYHPTFKGLLDLMVKTEPQHVPITELLKYMNMIRHD